MLAAVVLVILLNFIKHGYTKRRMQGMREKKKKGQEVKNGQKKKYENNKKKQIHGSNHENSQSPDASNVVDLCYH